MTYKELWQQIMYYKGHDRMPVIHLGIWPETRKRWIKEGMPQNVNEHEYLNAVPHWTWIGVKIELYPPFEEEVIKETEEYRIIMGSDGVVQQEWKNQSCIPHYIDFTLKTARDWNKYKIRLQPHPDRIPKDLNAKIKWAEKSGLPIAIDTASLMGWIRNWMGVENMSYLMYDNPDVYADMVNTIAELACWGIDQVVPRMKEKPDMGFGWEDICGKAGPLVSPNIFKRCVAPGYMRIRKKLEEYGINLLGIDSDGDVKPLLGLWFESGVNVQYPIEIGTWKADTLDVRKQFGKELRIVGGFDKLVLEKGHSAIDTEIEHLIPLMKDGGYIVMPDHLITPGTPLENYKYYLNRIRSLRF